MSDRANRDSGSDSTIEMRGISKAFPGVRALHEVSFSVRAGEVHALVGENGAGKSTLIKILSGVYRADAGEIVVHGEVRDFRHAMDALAAGISVIHQEFSLLPERTVAQNIFLGREPVKGLWLDVARMEAETRRVLGLFTGHRIAPDTMVRELDVASQQIVEIAKAISLDARVIVMDEPTAALSETECEVLFGIVDKLRARGTAVIYITHRMREVTRLADRVSVLKDGEVAASFSGVPDTDAVVHAMVGRDIEDFYAPPAAPGEVGNVVLSVAHGTNAELRDVSFELRSGEITAIAGLQGSGREQLAMAVFGDEAFTSGTMMLAGREVAFRQPRDAIRAGIGLLPGDRKAEALLLMQSVRDNGMLTTRGLAGLIAGDRRTAEIDVDGMDGLFDRMEVRAPSYEQEMRFLSGGNQQKAVIARWLAMKPKVLVFVEPTRGIDVNAKAGIYHLMRDLARGAAAIMMISSDLPEVLGSADRILVMREGRLVADLPRGVSETEVMRAATSGTEPDRTAA